MRMAKETKAQKLPLNYDRVVLADIRRSRRGKHRNLMDGIFQDLESLPAICRASRVDVARLENRNPIRRTEFLHLERGVVGRCQAPLSSSPSLPRCLLTGTGGGYRISCIRFAPVSA
jgi:hypothetical protein